MGFNALENAKETYIIELDVDSQPLRSKKSGHEDIREEISKMPPAN